METVSKILKILENIGQEGGPDLYIKVILAILTLLGGIYGYFWKIKARKQTAKDQSQRDRTDNISDNIKDEDQNTSDGQSVRDRLGRK